MRRAAVAVMRVERLAIVIVVVIVTFVFRCLGVPVLLYRVVIIVALVLSEVVVKSGADMIMRKRVKREMQCRYADRARDEGGGDEGGGQTVPEHGHPPYLRTCAFQRIATPYPEKPDETDRPRGDVDAALAIFRDVGFDAVAVIGDVADGSAQVVTVNGDGTGRRCAAQAALICDNRPRTCR